MHPESVSTALTAQEDCVLVGGGCAGIPVGCAASPIMGARRSGLSCRPCFKSPGLAPSGSAEYTPLTLLPRCWDMNTSGLVPCRFSYKIQAADGAPIGCQALWQQCCAFDDLLLTAVMVM